MCSESKARPAARCAAEIAEGARLTVVTLAPFPGLVGCGAACNFDPFLGVIGIQF